MRNIYAFQVVNSDGLRFNFIARSLDDAMHLLSGSGGVSVDARVRDCVRDRGWFDVVRGATDAEMFMYLAWSVRFFLADGGSFVRPFFGVVFGAGGCRV